MTKINLLPWREELRQELKRQFFAVLVGVAFIGAGSVYLFDVNIQSQITGQRANNKLVVDETLKLDKQIKEIKELQSKRARLVERMNVIQNLQGNRPVVVHVFEELAKVVPDGLYYKTVSNKNNVVSIKGIAETNNRVSNLMRNLDKSSMFFTPNLSMVKNSAGSRNKNKTDAKQKKWSEFTLTVKQGQPAAKKEED